MKLDRLPRSCALCIVLLVGCHKRADEVDRNWISPIKISESIDSLAGGMNLYKWQNMVIALQGLYDRPGRCFLLNSDAKSWSEVQFTGAPLGYRWNLPVMDRAGDGLFLQQGYKEDDQVVMGILTGRAAGNVALRDVVERKWITKTKELFAVAPPNRVKLTVQPRREDL